MKIKKLISFLMILGVVGFVSQTVSAQFDSIRRNTNRVDSFPQCDKANLSPIKCGFYEEGYQDGAEDAKNNRDSDHRRYRSKFDNQYESFYRSGYDEGYNSVRPTSRWTNQQRDAYDQGYGFGDNDRNRRISRLPGRYEGRYDRALETYYQKGYFDGYDNKPKQYDTPMGNIPTTPFPNPGNNRNRGTATGTLTWNGRVDNRVNIVLQGEEVKTNIVAGRLSGVYHNLQGVLPRRNATLSVIKLDGRGTVRVIQQPTRDNNYTAMIEVYDAEKSDDNYNLQIRWQSSNVQETYSSGKVNWSGRVDATVDIKISGDYVESVDQTGSGLTVIRENLEGYLAARNGTFVRVNKKNGRGTVTIIEQPNSQNDYTAVVRIFDPQGGDGEYDIEITW